MQNINIEKITAYVVVIGTIYMFWQSQMSLNDKMADIRERVARLEATSIPRATTDTP